MAWAEWVCVPPSLPSWEMPHLPKMLLPHGAPGPPPRQSGGGLELERTPPPTPAPGEPCGPPGPLLSCARLSDNGVCFCLPSWKTPTAPSRGWRRWGPRPFPAVSPGHLLTPQSCRCFGGSGVTPLHLSEGDAERGDAVGPMGGQVPPSSLPLLAGFLPELLAVSSCCPQPTSEEPTGAA